MANSPEDVEEASKASRPGSVPTDLTASVPMLVKLQSDAFPEVPRIGPYVLLDLLGEGGMGTVYAAYHSELDRQVAVKLLRSARGVDGAAEVRLLREAQALAKLDHPNVVGVHDAGVYQGNVYLVMERVVGGTLADWSKEKQRTWREVRDAFVQAGQGLAAAHAAGLVHRDFKPTNVLFGKDGRIKVADFGLARAADSLAPEGGEGQGRGAEALSSGASRLSATVTQVGTVVGTRAYMAPEQFVGAPADAKSDQFSFCVALWDALYGQRPFKDIPAPGQPWLLTEPTEKREVPPFLRAVAAKGLSQSPEKRFASMQDLLVALNRDPAKTRRRWLTAAVAVAGVALLGVGLARYVQGQSQRCTGAEQKLTGVWDEATRQKVHAAFTASGLPYAEDVWKSLDGDLGRYAAGWVAQHTEACEATWLKGDQSDSVLSLRMQCLEERREELKALTEGLAHADAKAVGRAGKAATSLTILDRCADVPALERRTPLPKNAEAQGQVEALQRELFQVSAQVAAGRYQEALPPIEKVMSEANALGYPPLQAEAAKWLIKVKGPLGQYDGIQQLGLDAIRLSEQSGDDSTRLQTLLLLTALGNETGQPYEHMLSYCQLAAAILPRIKDNGWHRIRVETLTGSTHIFRNHPKEALEAYQRALALAEKDDALWDQRILALGNVGLAYRGLGQVREGRNATRQALALSKGRLGPRHPEIAFLLADLASSSMDLNELDEALAYIDESLSIKSQTLGPEHLITTADMTDRAQVLMLMGRLDEAERVSDQALKQLAATGTNTMFHVSALFVRGQIHAARGHYAQALTLLRQGDDLGQKIEFAPSPRHSINEAIVLWKLGKLAEAEQVLVKALALLAKTPDHSDLHEARFTLAQVRWQLGRPKAEVYALAESALVELQAAEGDTRERMATLKAWLASHPPVQ